MKFTITLYASQVTEESFSEVEIITKPIITLYTTVALMAVSKPFIATTTPYTTTQHTSINGVSLLTTALIITFTTTRFIPIEELAST